MRGMKKGGLQEEYIKMAYAFSKKFKDDSNILGITLNGGVARGTGDEFSEIDLHFYVKNKKSKKLPPTADITINGVWFDISIYQINKDMKEKWSMNKRWDASFAQILWQKNKVITKLYSKRLTFEKEEKNKLMNEALFKAGWCYQLAEMFNERGEILN